MPSVQLLRYLLRYLIKSFVYNRVGTYSQILISFIKVDNSVVVLSIELVTEQLDLLYTKKKMLIYYMYSDYRPYKYSNI